MISLEKNRKYCLIVKKVVNNRKSFGSPNKKHVNDITFTDGHDEIACEYVSLDDNQGYFIEGEKACFELKFYKNDKMPTYEIEPVGTASEWRYTSVGVHPLVSDPLASGYDVNEAKAGAMKHPMTVEEAQEAMRYSKEAILGYIDGDNRSVSGQARTFALAYAKDLMVAEINTFGTKISEEETQERMFALAGKFTNYLLGKPWN
jgi:hypothetical protein